MPTSTVWSELYELSALQCITYASFELSVKVVPFPPGHSGAGNAIAALAVAGSVVTAEADFVDSVAAVWVILDVAVECVADVECVSTVPLSVDVVELLASVLEAAPSGQPPPGLHGSTEQHPLNPFAQL